MFRWRGVDRKQLAGRLQGYCGRPASSLGMAGTQGGGSLVASPSIRYNRTRRSSMSYYEENNRQSSQYNLQVRHNCQGPQGQEHLLCRPWGGLEPRAM